MPLGGRDAAKNGSSSREGHDPGWMGAVPAPTHDNGGLAGELAGTQSPA